MNFDPRVVEIYSATYGPIKFYTNSAFQIYLEHLDNLIQASLRPRQNLNKLLFYGENELKTAKTQIKKKRGRPKGSKNKTSKLFKNQNDLAEQVLKKKAQTHIVKKEPFETTKEFLKRQKEEIAN